jgi:hypothetical protein
MLYAFPIAFNFICNNAMKPIKIVYYFNSKLNLILENFIDLKLYTKI